MGFKGRALKFKTFRNFKRWNVTHVFASYFNTQYVSADEWLTTADAVVHNWWTSLCCLPQHLRGHVLQITAHITDPWISFHCSHALLGVFSFDVSCSARHSIELFADVLKRFPYTRSRRQLLPPPHPHPISLTSDHPASDRWRSGVCITCWKSATRRHQLSSENFQHIFWQATFWLFFIFAFFHCFSGNFWQRALMSECSFSPFRETSKIRIFFQGSHRNESFCIMKTRDEWL